MTRDSVRSRAPGVRIKSSSRVSPGGASSRCSTAHLLGPSPVGARGALAPCCQADIVGPSAERARVVVFLLLFLLRLRILRVLRLDFVFSAFSVSSSVQPPAPCSSPPLRRPLLLLPRPLGVPSSLFLTGHGGCVRPARARERDREYCAHAVARRDVCSTWVQAAPPARSTDHSPTTLPGTHAATATAAKHRRSHNRRRRTTVPAPSAERAPLGGSSALFSCIPKPFCSLVVKQQVAASAPRRRTPMRRNPRLTQWRATRPHPAAAPVLQPFCLQAA